MATGCGGAVGGGGGGGGGGGAAVGGGSITTGHVVAEVGMVVVVVVVIATGVRNEGNPAYSNAAVSALVHRSAESNSRSTTFPNWVSDSSSSGPNRPSGNPRNRGAPPKLAGLAAHPIASE